MIQIYVFIYISVDYINIEPHNIRNAESSSQFKAKASFMNSSNHIERIIRY